MTTVSLLRKKSFALTAAAQRKARQLLEQEGHPSWGLRVRVVGGGCSGLSYKMETAENPHPERDQVFEYDDLRVFIDRKSMAHLAGTILDYADSFDESGFVFKNPNATGTCGCGVSFSAG